MKYRFIPAFVMLLAGLIACLIGIVEQWPVKTHIIALAIVLVVFYIIGQIAGQIIGRVQSERKAMDELEKRQREAEEQRRKEEEEERIKQEKEAALAEENERRRKIAEQRYAERQARNSIGDDDDDSFDDSAFDENGNYIGE